MSRTYLLTIVFSLTTFVLKRFRFLCLVFLKVSLINGIFDFDFDLLLDLVVADDQGLSLESSIVEVGFGNSSLVRLLVADESIVSFLSFLELDALNGTKLRKDAIKIFFVPRFWKIFDVKVAFLLTVLVFDSLTLFLDLSVRLLHGVSDVKFLAILSTFYLLSVKSVNGFLSALRSIFLIDSLWIVVANESDLTDGVFL